MTRSRRMGRSRGALALLPLLASCMIGLDYLRPQAPTAPDWIESDSEGLLQRTEADTRAWWRVFGDPVLDSLVEAAYRQNPTLRSAGSRVLEGLARRGIAIGTLFPQQQGAFAAYERVRLSENRANQEQGDPALTTGSSDSTRPGSSTSRAPQDWGVRQRAKVRGRRVSGSYADSTTRDNHKLESTHA